MELHQIQVTYQAEEDRILCRASFKEGDGSLQEVRAWLTRRMVRGLWQVMIVAMEKQVTLCNPGAAHVSSDVVGMEHYASIEAIRESGSFDCPYQGDIRGYPLGETPILVTTAHFNWSTGDSLLMTLSPADGNGFEITFSHHMLHGFCSLLLEAVKISDWDLGLALPGTEASTIESRVLN